MYRPYDNDVARPQVAAQAAPSQTAPFPTIPSGQVPTHPPHLPGSRTRCARPPGPPERPTPQGGAVTLPTPRLDGAAEGRGPAGLDEPVRPPPGAQAGDAWPESDRCRALRGVPAGALTARPAA